ncbi:MAG: hypothetical protein WD341_06080 [Tistlia sp.]|uniref:hypothetical protein n=1 Tax=Tistlia sp. TaxID=3057121 RepID=UPI0034A5A8C3
MTLRATMQNEGSLLRIVREESASLTRARNRTITETTEALRDGYRRAVQSGTPGRRLSSAVRSRLYSATDAEGGAEVEAGIVYSKAKKRGADGQVFDLVELLSRGETVRPTRKNWLLIPNPGHGVTRAGNYSRRGLNRALAKIRAAAANPEAHPDIYFQELDGGRRLLIVEKKKRGRRSTILGVLVRQVRIPKQYDLEGVFRGIERGFSQRLAEHWQREMGR